MAYLNGQRPSFIQQSCLEFKVEQFTYQELETIMFHSLI